MSGRENFVNYRAIGIALAACVVVGSASANFIAVDYGSYTVVYDDSSSFGAPSFSSEAGASKSFGWSVPASVNSLNPAGKVFNLPQFFIKPNTGFALSGPVDLFLGNFVFAETSSPDSRASTGATLTGWAVKDENYAAAALVLKTLDRNVTATTDALTIGTYNGTATAATSNFSSLGFWFGQLTFEATGGYSAVVVGQPQNLLQVSLIATAVPEPETAALMIAGCLTLGVVVWRRPSLTRKFASAACLDGLSAGLVGARYRMADDERLKTKNS